MSAAQLLPSALLPLPPPPDTVLPLLRRPVAAHYPGLDPSSSSFSLNAALPAEIVRQSTSNLYLELAQGHLAASSAASFRQVEADADDGDEWEDTTDEEATGEREAPARAARLARLVVLSKHPAFIVTEVRGHAGVLVAVRRRKGDQGPEGEEDVFLEQMPLATRIGMRLLYHGVGRGRLLKSRRIERVFQQWSVRQGRRVDNTYRVLERIEHFVQAYHIDTTDLLEPDLAAYPTLNSFFYRKLMPSSRPPASPSDTTVISSAADCRLTVFESVSAAKKLWIKGQHFTLYSLLQDKGMSATLADGPVAIFRLAPADYHRYHSPVPAVVGATNHIPGDYYTVNSMIVRDKRFDVFTANKRDVTTLHTVHPLTGAQLPVAFVQIGALLAASIKQTKKEGKAVKRGDELGYFAYGGSTVVAIFPPGTVKWQEDLLRNSTGRNEQGVQVETLVKVGEKIGRWVGG
ncbi:hypothetical protein JCM10207_007770 [Rhodosporidiobolus poonsookiae]